MDDIKLAGKKQNINPMWKFSQQWRWFGRTNIFPGSCIPGMHSTTMPNKQRYCGQLQNHVRIANFRGVSWEITIPSKILVFHHGLKTWLVMQRNVWNAIVSWQTRRLNNPIKYLLHASMTTTSKKKKWNLLETCHKYALKVVLKCLYLARIGRPDILWSVNKLATVNHKMDQSLSTNAWID